MTIAFIGGSLRRNSYSSRIAKLVIDLLPSDSSGRIVRVGDLPLYNEDLEVEPPAQWVRFRDEIEQASAIIFVTPEYNRGVPAVLKNAIDVGSRPFGKGALAGKSAAVISHSLGAMGGCLANHALRPSLLCLGMPTMPVPEIYLGHVASCFDETGAPTAGVAALMSSFAGAFCEWIN